MNSSLIVQGQPNTCLAACVAMLRVHAGDLCTEHDVIRQWGRPDDRGYRLSQLDRDPRLMAIIGPLTDESISSLQAAAAAQPIIAVVWGGPWTVFTREYSPMIDAAFPSPIATLSDNRADLLRMATPHHAIVLRYTDAGFVAFDPYHLPRNQPLNLSPEWLFAVAAGWFWQLSP